MKKYIFILAAALTAGANLLHAQSTEHKGLLWSSLHGLDYEFKAGVNIGGTSPLPLPKRDQKFGQLLTGTCHNN